VDDVIFAIQRCSHSNDITSRLVRQRTARFDVMFTVTSSMNVVLHKAYK